MGREKAAEPLVVTDIRRGIIPAVSAIWLPDGKGARAWLDRDPDSGAPTRLRCDEPQSYERLLASAHGRHASVTFVTERRDSKMDLRIAMGEGELGGDGAIAVWRLSTGALLWAGFFEESNPFVSAEAADGALVLRTNADDQWTFSIAEPRSAAISAAR